MQVLVVETHEGELDARELAFLDIGLGGAEAHFADLLPVGIGRRALADAGDLQDLGAQIVLRRSLSHDGPNNSGAAQCGKRACAGGTLQYATAAGLQGHEAVMYVYPH